MTLRMSNALPGCYIAVSVHFEQDAAAQARVPTITAPAPIAWCDDHYLHMTVAYLGWLARDTARAVARRLGKHAIRGPEQIRLTGRLQVVGKPGTQSLIAPVEATEELACLRLAAEECLQESGADDAPAPGTLAPFRPHVTLGRVSPRADDTGGWFIPPLRAALGPVQLRVAEATWGTPD
jgi:2'-5' RNA ligase